MAEHLAELLVEFTVPVERGGQLYWPRALTRKADDGLWEGWLEFRNDGNGEVIRTARETEQPSRDEVMYWATGLSATYLEGALDRALRPAPERPRAEERVFVDSAPRPVPRGGAGLGTRVVLDPFTTYAEGEHLLRKQLHALSRDHLHNIIEAYQLAGDHGDGWVRSATDDQLVDRIVAGVRQRMKRQASP